MAFLVLCIGALAMYFLPSSAGGYAVGGTVALLIAFVAYPWQKYLDRKDSFGNEQRAALREFLENWYSLEADTRNLKQFEPTAEEPFALNERLFALRTRRKQLSYGFLLICAEEDVQAVIEMDQAHDTILDNFRGRLQSWLEDPNKGELSAKCLMGMAGEAISIWEMSHKAHLEELTNRCRERTPFVEHKTLIRFGDPVLKD